MVLILLSGADVRKKKKKRLDITRRALLNHEKGMEITEKGWKQSQCARKSTVSFKKALLHFRNAAAALAWKIPWTEEPGGLQSMGSLRVPHY